MQRVSCSSSIKSHDRHETKSIRGLVSQLLLQLQWYSLWMSNHFLSHTIQDSCFILFRQNKSMSDREWQWDHTRHKCILISLLLQQTSFSATELNDNTMCETLLLHTLVVLLFRNHFLILLSCLSHSIPKQIHWLRSCPAVYGLHVKHVIQRKHTSNLLWSPDVSLFNLLFWSKPKPISNVSLHCSS